MTLARRWERFWFSPEPTSTLAVLRIVYGFMLLAWAATLSVDAGAFFSRTGILPERPQFPGNWTVLDAFRSDTAVTILMAVLFWAAVLVVIGFHTRLSSVVAFVAIVSLHRRNPFVFQAGDNLLRSFSFYFVFAPAGVALSVDRWRKARARFWEFPLRAPWALRLVQVQLSILYLFSVWEKVRGQTWNNGTAVSWSMRIDELVRFPVPSLISQSLLISNIMTFGTLAVEASLAFLLWNRRARPWVLAAGIVLHLGIEITMRVGFFSLVIFLYYVAFVTPEAMSTVLLALRRRLGRSRFALLQGLGRAGPMAGGAPEVAARARRGEAIPGPIPSGTGRSG